MSTDFIISIIPLLIPIALIQYGLAIYCIIDIVKNDVKNLNKAGWILIVLFINFIGSILYLTIGRKGYSENDKD